MADENQNDSTDLLSSNIKKIREESPAVSMPDTFTQALIGFLPTIVASLAGGPEAAAGGAQVGMQGLNQLNQARQSQQERQDAQVKQAVGLTENQTKIAGENQRAVYGKQAELQNKLLEQRNEAVLKSQAPISKEEQAKLQFQEQSKNLEKDKYVSNLKEKFDDHTKAQQDLLDSVQELHGLLDQNTPGSGPIIAQKMANLAKITRALPESAAFGQAPDLADKVSQFFQKQKEGNLSSENIGNARKITDSFGTSASQNINKYAQRIVDQNPRYITKDELGLKPYVSRTTPKITPDQAAAELARRKAQRGN